MTECTELKKCIPYGYILLTEHSSSSSSSSLGLLITFVFITFHSCSISNSAFDLFLFCFVFFNHGSFQTINHAKIHQQPNNKSSLLCFPQLYADPNQSVWKVTCNYLQRPAQPVLLDTFRMETRPCCSSENGTDFICLHF